MLRQDLSNMSRYVVLGLLALINASTFSCKATDLNSLLEDGPQGTVEPKNRAEDFNQIASLINAAMYMIPYNIEETEKDYKYMEGAAEAADVCQAPAAGQPLDKDCNERLYELFAASNGLKHAAYAQSFFVDSNNSFRNSLESRTAKKFWDFQLFAETSDELDAVQLVQKQLSDELKNTSLAEITILPTVHFDEGGAPRCFSYSIKMRPLQETASVGVVIPTAEGTRGFKTFPLQKLPGHKGLDVLDWTFTYEAGDLGPTDQDLWQNRYFAGQFNRDFAASQTIKFGVIDGSFQKGVDITAGKAGEGVSSLDCHREDKQCGFLVGEVKPAAERCRIFRSAQ